MTTVYLESLDDVKADDLRGFFVGWPKAPSPETLLKVLKGSYAVVIARDGAAGEIIGFINAISDGILSAHIPLLEVLPAHQGRGIGLELTSRLVKRLGGLYMIDTACDAHLESFYRKAGFSPALAMIRRDYAAQSGRQ